MSGGFAALPAQLRFCLSVVAKRVFLKRRYPLLFLAPWRNGFFKTLKLLARLRMTKVIRLGRYRHFSLLEPRWPSPAYEHLIARGGLNLAAAGTAAKVQIDLAVLGITRACPYRCAHCYERFNLASTEAVTVDRWREVIREIQQIGVSVVALSGGEPFARFDDALSLLETADRSRSDFHLFTTGHGATPERVKALARAGLVAAAVGLDDFEPSRHDAIRAHRGAFDDAVRAIRLFSEAGILTYVNACMTKGLVERDGLYHFYELLRALGVGALQLLEPRPCGGYATCALDTVYGPEERTAVREFFEATNRSPRYRRYPAVYFPALMEAPENLGCMGGGLSHLYIDSLGNVEPCVFLPVSFGNITREGFRTVYERMRQAMPRPTPQCPSLHLAKTVGFTPDRQAQLPVAYESIREQWSHRSGVV